MVWAPAYGAGYPFGRSYGAVDAAGQRIGQVLDTDGNGTVDDGDDPYAPYFPGDRYVDWVGLSLYHYGDRQDFGNNAAPAAGEFEARLDDRFGLRRPAAAPVRSTTATRRGRARCWSRRRRSSTRRTTAATRSAGSSRRGGARSWPAPPTTRPSGRSAGWSWTRPEAEIDDEVADWRATHTPGLARALRADLDASDVALGPVTRVVDPGSGSTDGSSPAAAGADGSASDDGEPAGASADWVPVGLALLAVGYLVYRLITRRRSSSVA